MEFECHKKSILSQRRCCGSEYKTNEYYLKSSRMEADRLINIGLNANTSILDIGCAQGRFAIGLLDKIGEMRYYRGVDVQKHSITWCKEFITKKHPNFQFIHIDVKNERYNRKGKSIDKDFRFPFKKEEFDIIYLFSVFTHMIVEDIRIYLREFQRLLSSSGKVFFTAFVENGVPNMSINPDNYIKGIKWKGRLHCVRYDRKFFESLLIQTGFKIDRCETTAEWEQKGFYISKR